MKFLIVAGYFPPYAPASASRVNKWAKYLEDQGHDVRVLAPKYEAFKQVLVPEISPERVHYTYITRINDFPKKVKAGLKSLFGRKSTAQEVSGKGSSSPTGNTEKSQESGLSQWYRRLTNIPDDMVGWYPHAIKEGRKMFSDWSPDVIFATMPPMTTMFVARRLGRMIDVPVVYDYRDLWTDHPYYDRTGFGRSFDRLLENFALKHCAGLVTVTKTWAEHLKSIRSIPVEFAMNGFDPADFNPQITETYDPEKITLLYAGYLYGDKRDPSIVFEALGKLGDLARHFNVLIYVPYGEKALNERQKDLIRKHDLSQVVQCHPYIPQKQLLEIQQKVDVLMLLRWDDPSENGVIAGKLFEYIGAGRPILSLGSVTGEAADIIRENNFGIVSNDVDEVAAYLKDMLERKQQGKDIAALNPNREKFTRARQFEKLLPFMEKIVADWKQRKG